MTPNPHPDIPEAEGLPDGIPRLSPTVEYRQFSGQGYKPTAVMRPDPKGDYFDAGLTPAIRGQERERTLTQVAEAFETRGKSEAILCSEVAAYCREQITLLEGSDG